MSKAGPKVLLTPEDGFLLLIDHLPFQFTKQHSQIQTKNVNNIFALAKTTNGLQDVYWDRSRSIERSSTAGRTASAARQRRG